jgi:hypothetical protein
MKILALILGTGRELAAKATVYVLLAISTIVLLGVLVSVSSSSTAEGKTLMLFGNTVSPPSSDEMFSDIVSKMEATLAGGLFFGISLFGMFATAGVITDALDKGTVDLYLSKPIARWELLFGKYLGGVAVILVNIVYFIGALWLIVGMKTGVWNVSFLVASVLMTFVFACLYAIVTYVGVVSRNTAIAIIGGFVYLFIVAELLQSRERGLYLLGDNTFYRGAVDGLYYLLPQLPAMQATAFKYIGGNSLDWRPFAQSFLSACGFFGLAAWTLEKTDF